jgi:sugar/nucleoside kinase (ribokinase family)
MEHPEFLAIGHICQDKTATGMVPGGAAAYATRLAANLGFRTAVLTSASGDFALNATFPSVAIENAEAPFTTVFENIYENGARRQLLHQRALPLVPSQLPAHWRGAKTVLLGPIADEVSLEFIGAFENAVVCVCPQGWMRKWDASGQVSFTPLKNWKPLFEAAIISMSERDTGNDWPLMETTGKKARLLIVTQGAKGATIFVKGKKRFYPAMPATELDPTGAGDVFAAAFTLHFCKTKDVETSAAFAHAAASLSVEASGVRELPGKEMVEERFKQYLEKFCAKR